MATLIVGYCSVVNGENVDTVPIVFFYINISQLNKIYTENSSDFQRLTHTRQRLTAHQDETPGWSPVAQRGGAGGAWPLSPPKKIMVICATADHTDLRKHTINV